jgi:hypothetical protein
MQMLAFGEQRIDLRIGGAPVVDGFREGLPPVEIAELADQAVDVVGMVLALHQPAPRRRDIDRLGGEREPGGAIAARDGDVGQERVVIGLAFQMRITVEIQHRHLLRLGIAPFAHGIGAGLVDNLDRLPARGERQQQQGGEHAGHDGKAARLRARTRGPRSYQDVANEVAHVWFPWTGKLFTQELKLRRQFESKGCRSLNTRVPFWDCAF